MSRFVLAGLAVGCAAPEVDQLFNEVQFDFLGADDAEARFVDAVDAATSTLHVALPDAEDPDLLDAIGAAFDRGVQVELVVDFDDQDDPALQPLFDLGVPMQLACAGVSYFEFALNQDVRWTSEQTVMSHAYVVVDGQRVVTATTAGHLRTGDRVVTELRGEEIVEDWLIEHNQLFGGVDATAMTAFDSPAKSIADWRWRYGTTTPSMLEIWYGPQERLTKRVTDAIYSARSAVWVMTDDLANEGIFRALADKAAWDFDVRVITGPALGASSTALRRAYDNDVREARRRELLDVEEVPTVVIVDPDPDNAGWGAATQVMVISHDLYSSARLYRGQEVLTDQLVDGSMLVLDNRSERQRAEIERFVKFYRDRFDQGVPR